MTTIVVDREGAVIIPIAVVAALLLSAADPTSLSACAMQIGQPPRVAGVTVTDLPESEGAMRMLNVATPVGPMTVLYDAASESAARRYAPCLGAQVMAVVAGAGGSAGPKAWHSVVFTRDENYTPTHRQGMQPRWVIPTLADGSLSARGRMMLVMVVPHEQIHAYHRRAEASVPRWFTEGHATWLGDRLSAQIDPAEVARDQKGKADRLRGFTGPSNVGAWGSARPKREAILRQVSPEERAKMEADPKYRPQGTFRFTQDDFEGDDESLTPARYAASARIFDTLVARFGVEKVNAFVDAVTAEPGFIPPPKMGELTQRFFAMPLDAVYALGTPPA